MELLLIIVSGYLLGVFVNYLTDVLPIHLRLTSVTCQVCQAPFPFKTYFLFQKCPSCEANRPKKSFLLSFIIVFSSVVLWYLSPERLGFYLSSLIFFYLFIITVIDIQYRLVLSSLSIIGVILFFGIGVYLHGFIATILGGIAGFLIMYLLYGFGVLFSKIIGKFRKIPDMEPGMGKGDISISGIIGFLLGWPGITAGILLGIIMGGVASIIVILVYLFNKSYKPNIGIPYVPFLAISTLLLLFR